MYTVLQWHDVWRTAFNEFIQEHDVTEKYLGLDCSTVPALIRYRYCLGDRCEKMAYDYKLAFPTTWASQAVRNLLINDSSYECRQHGCKCCEYAWACFEAKKEQYMSQVYSRYKDMQLYRVSYDIESESIRNSYCNYVFAAHPDNVSRILREHHGKSVRLFRNDQVISPLPIPTEERFVSEKEVSEDKENL